MNVKILDREVELIFDYEVLERLAEILETDFVDDVLKTYTSFDMKRQRFSDAKNMAHLINASIVGEKFDEKELKEWAAKNRIINIRTVKKGDKEVLEGDAGIIWLILPEFYKSINLGQSKDDDVKKKEQQPLKTLEKSLSDV